MKRRGWLPAAVRWGTLVVVILLPIFVLVAYSYRLLTKAVHDLVLANNTTAASITAELVSRELSRSVSLGTVFSGLPGVLTAVENRDGELIRQRLRTVVESYPGIDRAFVTDPAGVLWSDYPAAPESLGQSFAERDWYRGVSRAWAPYVSDVYQRRAAPQPLVVAVAVPLRKDGTVLGVLVCQYRLDGLTAWLRQIQVGEGGYVFVVDQSATVAAHPRLELRAQARRDYATEPAVQQALRGQVWTGSYVDPITHQAVLATALPVLVNHQRWAIVAQQPAALALAPLGYVRTQLTTATVILTMAGGAVIVVLGRITERLRRLNEAVTRERTLLRSLIDNLPDHIHVKDTAGRYLVDNVAHARFLGAPGPAAVVGKTIHDFVPAKLADQYAADDERVLQSGAAFIDREDQIVDADGAERWVATTKVPLRDEQDAVTGLVCIRRDITAHKNIEEALARSNKELEMFAYVASHDLQEPLRAVSGCVELLQEGYRDRLDPHADQLIKYVVDGAARMRTLINDLLAYARVTTRGKPFAPTSLAEVFQNARLSVEAAARESGAQLTTDPLPTVLADPTQMHQLFQNLLSNAIKYRLKDRAPVIHVGAQREAEGWRFTVRDNGIGIEAQYYQRIFGLFQRLHGREEYSGTGIGLALCQKIVERHGGRIGVESVPGQGSTFCFTLPDRRPET